MFSARALESTALECRLCTKRTPTDFIPGPPSVKPGGGLLVFCAWAEVGAACSLQRATEHVAAIIADAIAELTA